MAITPLKPGREVGKLFCSIHPEEHEEYSKLWSPYVFHIILFPILGSLESIWAVMSQ